MYVCVRACVCVCVSLMVWLSFWVRISGYAHVFVLFSIAIVILPLHLELCGQNQHFLLHIFDVTAVQIHEFCVKMLSLLVLKLYSYRSVTTPT